VHIKGGILMKFFRDPVMQNKVLNTVNSNTNNILDEISEIEENIQGGCSTNTFTLSDYLGNKGGWCTLTKECQPNCN